MLCLFLRILSYGADFSETKFMSGPRKAVCQWLYCWACHLNCLLVGITYTKKTLGVDDCDYSYYLGPDYKNDKPKFGEKGRVSKMVAPHVSLFDVEMLISAYGGDLSFLAGQ